jgi:transposase
LIVIRFALHRFAEGTMGVAVAVTRMDLDAAGLRRAASQSRDANAARRMLAVALVLEGRTRTEAAAQCGMQRQTLRDWVHRYNEFGLPGLSDRVPPGAQRRLSPEQEAAVAQWVREGPTLAQHGVVRWRRTDLSREIAARFGVHLAERSVGAMLRRLGFRRLSVRPRHPGRDAAAQEAHKKILPSWSLPRSRNAHAASRLNCGGRCYEEGRFRA